MNSAEASNLYYNVSNGGSNENTGTKSFKPTIKKRKSVSKGPREESKEKKSIKVDDIVVSVQMISPAEQKAIKKANLAKKKKKQNSETHFSLHTGPFDIFT